MAFKRGQERDFMRALLERVKRASGLTKQVARDVGRVDALINSAVTVAGVANQQELLDAMFDQEFATNMEASVLKLRALRTYVQGLTFDEYVG